MISFLSGWGWDPIGGGVRLILLVRKMRGGLGFQLGEKRGGIDTFKKCFLKNPFIRLIFLNI